MNNSMKYILTLLISLAIMFPSYSDAASKKQAIKTEQKKLSYSQQKKVEKLVKKGKCVEGTEKVAGKRTKQVVYVCEK